MNFSSSVETKAATQRRMLLEMARRRVKPGTGSAISLLEQRMAVHKWPDLSPILKDIPWAVIGGVATRAYMPERATQDLDILIAGSDSKKARRRLSSAGFVYRHNLTIGGGAWQTPEGQSLDVVEINAPWLSEALKQLQTDPQGLPVLSLPYLVLLKFQASRLQDLADISRMLGLASAEDRQATRHVFAKWQPDELDDLESLITLGDLELGRDLSQG
ncbi:MAG: hypothetical protein DPW09_18885 [Anaerolineae bacterium]|nr:hypothetical protein [Anaerolineales bacterium]MCQ3975507.1 hypothetical protein [Anaerolineae bacterium]